MPASPSTTEPRPGLWAESPGAAWRVERAERAAVLIDGRAYLGALRQAMATAEHSIYIVGWDVDGRTVLGDPGKPPDDGLPHPLREFLIALVKRRPALRVHILLWDYAVFFSLSREFMPTLALGWSTPDAIRLGLDNAIPVEAAQHQKLVVIDDAVAFCGGMDIAQRRWDTPAHTADDARRADSSGDIYPPVHDVQMVVDGAAARAVGDHVRARWREALNEDLSAPPPRPADAPDAWPPLATGDENPDVVVGGPFDIALSRTVPPVDDQPGVFEISALYLDAVARAEWHLYIENQYLAAQAVADALIARLKATADAPHPLEILVITTHGHGGWLEDVTMTAARSLFAERLRSEGLAGRVRIVNPWVGRRGGPGKPTPVEVKVHSKLMVVDDTFLTIGSANLANRSLGLDCEMNLSLRAAPENREARSFIRAVRDRLLGEHSGAGVAAVAAHLDEGGGLLDVADALGDGRHGRGLAVLPDADRMDLTRLEPLLRLGNPERPIDLEDFLLSEAPPPLTSDRRPFVRHLWLGSGLLLLALALVAVWHLTPLGEAVDVDSIAALLETMRQGPWTPLAVMALFVGLGLVAFPVTVLIAATGALFGPLWGLAYAMIGTLASAAVAYGVGALAGRNLIRRYAGLTVNRLSRRLGEHGLVAVIIIRMVPVAPFTIVNLIAGASHLRAVDFLLGTFLGMLPGTVLMTVFGSSLAELLREPEPQHFVILGGIVTLWVTMSVVLQRTIARVRRKRAETEH